MFQRKYEKRAFGSVKGFSSSELNQPGYNRHGPPVKKFTSAAGEAVGAVCAGVTPESRHAGQTHTLSALLVAAAVAGAFSGALTGCNNTTTTTSTINNNSSRSLIGDTSNILPATCAARVAVVAGGALVT